MPSPSPEAFSLGEAHALQLPFEPRRGLAGERMGRGTGSSLEFQDRRSYQAGDDVRHLDWRAYARTDQLLVRQYREEILPRLEVLFDDSRSMGTDGAKAQRAVDLAAVFVGAARAAGCEVRLHSLGDHNERVELLRFEREGFELDGRRPLGEAVDELAPRLAPGSLRLVVSDFLSPHRADSLVRAAARETGALLLVQVLSRTDREPEVGQALRLTDAESDEALDLVVDEHARERYLRRLSTLGEALGSEAVRVGGRFLTLGADGGLRDCVRDGLVAEGVLAG